MMSQSLRLLTLQFVIQNNPVDVSGDLCNKLSCCALCESFSQRDDVLIVSAAGGSLKVFDKFSFG